MSRDSTKAVIFDGDGTLWRPAGADRNSRPDSIYKGNQVEKDSYNNLILVDGVRDFLENLRARGYKIFIVSAHPVPGPEADYLLEYFRRCLFLDQPVEFIVQQSETFYDFPWNYDETSPRQALKNNGPRVVQSGSAEGVMIGGNLCSLNLLNGTEYFPKIEGDIILCIEDDSYDSIPETFERHVQALMQQPFFRQVKAILVGRFQGESRATDNIISDIILSKNIDPTIPVIVNLDFGHTDPKFTYPVGGKCKVVAGDDIKIVIRCDG